PYLFRKRGLRYRQRVISGHPDGPLDPLKQNALLHVLQHRALTVHQPGGMDDGSAESRPNGLMAQAYPEDRDFSFKFPDQGNADSRLLRASRSRREKDSTWIHPVYFLQSNPIVPYNC